jgi:hypothetical protein
MSLYHDINNATTEEKEWAAKYFLDLAHSGKGYKAIKFYQNVNEEVRKYMRKDSSCSWEIDNLSTMLEA